MQTVFKMQRNLRYLPILTRDMFVTQPTCRGVHGGRGGRLGHVHRHRGGGGVAGRGLGQVGGGQHVYLGQRGGGGGVRGSHVHGGGVVHVCGGGGGGGAGPGRGLLAAAEVEEVEEGPGEAAHQVVKQRVRGGGAPGAGQLRGAGGRGHQRGGEQRQGEDLDQRHGGHGLPRVCRYNDD